MRNFIKILPTIATGFAGCFAALSAVPAFAADPARSFEASPDVYKVIAEGQSMRVVLVTWKPGQRDEWHSHAASAGYWLTDCNLRIYYPDGKFVDNAIKAERAFVQPPIASHSAENRSATECKLVMFEHE
jgi:hypothetical protein